MSKEVVIKYIADSKGNLTLFAVVKSNFNINTTGIWVSSSNSYSLYTDKVLWLNDNIKTETKYSIVYVTTESTLLKCIKNWREHLKGLGYTLTVLDGNNCSEIGTL